MPSATTRRIYDTQPRVIGDLSQVSPFVTPLVAEVQYVRAWIPPLSLRARQ